MARIFSQRVTWRVFVLILSEAALLVAAVLAAVWLQTGEPLNRGELWRAAIIAAVCQVCLYYADLYNFRVLSERREVFLRLLQALGSAALVLALLYFWFPSLVIGRGVFLLVAPAVILAVGGWRAVCEWITGRMGYRERLLLVGTSAATVALARELHDRRELGVHIVGFIDPDPARVGAPVFNPGVIGTIEDIPRIIRTQHVDRVVVSLADARGRLPMDRLLEMKLDGVAFDHLASVYEEYTGKIAVENLRPSWLIFSEGFRKGRALEAAKRAMDVAVAGAGLLAGLPVMALIAVAIRLTSPGRVLFRQARVGRGGRVFTLYKFRSMRENAEEETGAVWAREDDERVTPVGRWLRRTRLDELPQFWNVLRGDMSLVGPRPERPEFVEALTRQIPFYGQRHAVKPGLTGWAQIRYRYGSTVTDALEKLQYDLFYIKNMSIPLDLFILFKTVQIVVLRRGV
ncbi:MAG TPA: TIGR03013 family XrtA/PEP-CTERM system glycosyltransferase [Vicinamibacterales bacterium]|nr:TIGR03013 family XrtA/PEP-CTERM system glycosyltransferase [Vicinamibacterales bacterium]